MFQAFARTIGVALLLSTADAREGLVVAAPPSAVKGDAQEAPAPCSTPLDPGALANRNPPPKLIQIPTGCYPLFAIDYDWEEQSRVHAALRCFRDDSTEASWKPLLKGCDDDRYSLTIDAVDGNDDERESAINYTVSDFCAILARRRLTHIVYRHFPEVPDPRFERIDLDYGLETPAAFLAWMKTRKDKPLYEVQIELILTAGKALERPNTYPRDLRPDLRKALQTDLETLRRDKKPFEFPVHLYAPGFSAKEAEALRKRAAAAKK